MSLWEITVSPSCSSSRVMPYCRPEQPPPATKMRRARLGSFSCASSSRTFAAAVGVMLMKLVSVVGCWFCSIMYLYLSKRGIVLNPSLNENCVLDFAFVTVLYPTQNEASRRHRPVIIHQPAKLHISQIYDK